MLHKVKDRLYHGTILEISKVDVGEGKNKTMIGLSIVSVTKEIMEHFSIDHETAFDRLLSTDFYNVLNDVGSRLYLEENSYLSDACILELEQGKDAMYAFINE